MRRIVTLLVGLALSALALAGPVAAGNSWS